ncbi:hypothetical protein [Tsukamurella paurometabola]|uniref:Uncharacterized protein n=1 Tax=Tsukamurella paurometabola TaxID=2061 RepID=A0ABS5NHX7_TSUPA|nr:hypothetical protein [Tsukamurella paurometabola]MBS4103892.1 hypothetical protein [Tsukamurella paurometabola]
MTTPQKTTKTTTTETGDLDLAEIAAAFSPCPACERRTYEALRSAILAMPEGKPIRWPALRRRLPDDSADGLEACTALNRLAAEGVLVVWSGPGGATWIARATDADRALLNEQRDPRNGMPFGMKHYG